MTELAVLVPVLNRPQNVAPLVESFLAGCPSDSELLFLVQREDDNERKGINRVIAESPGYPDWARVKGLIVDAVTWPEKINIGITTGWVKADWYLFAADDIQFTPGWWDATKGLRDDPTVGVIGTNDSTDGTGNPRVAAGDHTCHPLVRASYIREMGTVDEKGVAVHAGYHHWYVDDELVHIAKARHAWAYCRGAVIEHLHPYWRPDQIQWDDTYTLGEKHATEDRALFESRIPLIQAEYAKHA